MKKLSKFPGGRGWYYEDDIDSIDEFDEITNISSNATASITTKCVIDGSYLLIRVVWDKNIIFREIINKYLSYVGLWYIQCAVVFDSYSGGLSTKDHEHFREDLKSSVSLDMAAVQLDNSIG